MLVEAVRSPEVVQITQGLKPSSSDPEIPGKVNVPAASSTATPVDVIEPGQAVFAISPEVSSASVRSGGGETSAPQEKYWRQVEAAKRALHDFTREQLSVFVDEPTGQLGMRIIDRRTGKVLRQIPAEQLLKMTARLRESLGAFLDQQA